FRNAAAGQAFGSSGQRHAFVQESRIAEAAAIHFRSSANQARFVLARRAIAAAKTPKESAPFVSAVEAVLKDEINLARRLYDLQSADSSIGFEASNHYFYVPIDLAEKVINCHDLLTNWVPKLKGAG